MRFHVDKDFGSEICLWVAPDHPDQIPQIEISAGQQPVAVMQANVLRDDVRLLGMHSTGQVGFSITSDVVENIERIADLMIVVKGEEADREKGLLIYRRSLGCITRGRRLLIMDTALGRSDQIWDTILTEYAQSYPDLERLNLETLMSVLGNELAPSIGAVGFPYLNRVRSILTSLKYQIVLMFRDPLLELARQIDHKTTTDFGISFNNQHANGAIPTRRALISMLRDIPEADAFELSNPVMRRLLKAPGEQVSSKDVTNALHQLAQLDLVVTDQTRDLLAGRGDSAYVRLPAPTAVTERQRQISEHLRHIGIATDMISEDLTLYALTSGAITRACTKMLSQTIQEGHA